PGADVDARGGRARAEQSRDRYVPAETTEPTDECDVAAYGETLERMRHGVFAADLEDLIDSATARQLANRLLPIRRLLVVDRAECSERLGALELLVVRARDDDFGACGNGEHEPKGELRIAAILYWTGWARF